MLQNSCVFCNILGHFGTFGNTPLLPCVRNVPISLGMICMSREWRRPFQGCITGVIRRSESCRSPEGIGFSKLRIGMR